MHRCSSLLADLGKATGTQAEPESRRRPSFLDAKALPSHVRGPTRTSLVSSNVIDGNDGSAPASSLPVPGSSRASGMLSIPQKSMEERPGQDSAGLARKGSATARDRWRNLGATIPKRPSFLAPSMPLGQPHTLTVRANAALLHMLALLGCAESVQEGVSHPALSTVQLC